MKKFGSIELGIPSYMMYKGVPISSLTKKTDSIRTRDNKKSIKLIPDTDGKLEIINKGKRDADGALEFGTAEVEIPATVVKRKRLVKTLTDKSKQPTRRKGVQSIRLRGIDDELGKVRIINKGQEVAIVARILKKLEEAPIPKKDISALKAKFQMAFKRLGFKKAVEQMREVAKKYAEKERGKLSAEEVKKKNEECVNEFHKKFEITDEMKTNLEAKFQPYYYVQKGLSVKQYDGWKFQPYYYYLLTLYGPKEQYNKDFLMKKMNEFFENNTLFENRRQKLSKMVEEFIKQYRQLRLVKYSDTSKKPEFSKEFENKRMEMDRCRLIYELYYKFAQSGSREHIYQFANEYIRHIEQVAMNMIESGFKETEAYYKDKMSLSEFKDDAEKWWKKQQKGKKAVK